MNTETQQHHYYGTTAFSWATGETRAEVLAKLARVAGSDIIKRNVKSSGGLYAWTVRVNLPQTAGYEIDSYRPVGVPTEKPQSFRIVNTKGYVIPDKE